MSRHPSVCWRSGWFWAKLGAGTAALCLIVVIGGIYWLKSNARVQREAVAAIKAEWGQVWYPWDDPQTSDSAVVSSRPVLPPWLLSWTWSIGESEEIGPSAPKWLVTLLGVDCFGDVTSVSIPRLTNDKSMENVGQLGQLKRLRIQNALMSERGMKSVSRLTRLEILTIVRSKVLDGGFAHMAELKNLQTLDLQGTNFDDESALACLKNLTALAELNLGGTKITDAGMPALGRLIKLEDLNLSRTLITDAGLSQAAGLPALSRLSLNGTKLSGAGLVHLKGLKRLEQLDLEGTRVGDEGLAHLAGSVNLNILQLKGTAIGDAGVAQLKNLTNLQELTLDRTAITDAGLAKLASLPHLAILSVQHTKVTEGAIDAMKRQRAQLQIQQLAASSSRVVSPETAISELEIVH